MTGDTDSKDYLQNIVPQYFDVNKMEKKYGGKMADISGNFFPPKL